MKIRMTALLLAILMILPACSEQTTVEESESSASSDEVIETVPEETEYMPDLPDVRYDGEDFKVCYQSGALAYNIKDLIVEELNGEIINDAVYNRNLEVEEEFGITFAAIPNADPSQYAKQDYISGSKGYDFLMTQMDKLMPMSLEGYFYDWNTLTYFNADEPWWDANAASGFSYNNRLYMMSGNISRHPHAVVRCMWFGKGIAEDYKLENMYDLVREGKWTIDTMIDLSQRVTTDKNGDGVYTEEDCIGFLSEGVSHFLTGCGVKFSGKDENNIPYNAAFTEHTVSAIEKVSELFNMPDAVVSYDDAGAGKDYSGYSHMWSFVRGEYFVGEHFLFTQIDPSTASSEFTEMERGYGVLPNPKMDETQNSYYHLVDKFACAMVLPADADNIEKTDVIVNYWAYASDELIDGFYETTLKHKRFDAPDDAEMLDLVRSTIVYDVLDLIDVGIQIALDQAIESGNVASTFKQNEKKINKTIEKYFGNLM